MNKVYLLIIFLLISCTSNNKIATKRQVQIKEKEIKYRYYDCSGNCNGKFSGYKQLTINYTPNVDILKIESELYNLNKEMI
jgi:hypothetical protein